MGFVKTIDICTVAHNCHGKSKFTHRKSKFTHGKSKSLTTKANSLMAKANHGFGRCYVHYNNNTDQKKPKEEAIFMTVFSQDWLHMQEQV